VSQSGSAPSAVKSDQFTGRTHSFISIHWQSSCLYLSKAVYPRPTKEAYMAVAGLLCSSVFSLLNNLGSSQNHSQQQISADWFGFAVWQSFPSPKRFCALQQYRPRGQQSSSATSAASSRNSNPLLTAVNQLGQALQSGNLSARPVRLCHGPARRPTDRSTAECRRRSSPPSPLFLRFRFPNIQPANRNLHTIQ
jgi:hypothetical protein